MTSDWKEGAIERADFRHTKSDPEVAPHRKKKRGKKPWKILCKLSLPWRKDREETEWVWGRYYTEKQALQAFNTKVKDPFLKGIRIEGPDECSS